MNGDARARDTFHADVVRMARSMHNTDRTAPLMPEEVISEVCAAAVTFFPAVKHSGVTLARGRHGKRVLESLGSTDVVARAIDELQNRLGGGPCVDATEEHETIKVPDYTVETRWPTFARDVVENTPVRASLSIQLFTDSDDLGALNLYFDQTQSFHGPLLDQALALGAHAAIALSGARRSEQFRSALASRDIIGQAKGIIMERFDVDALRAFQLLTKLSQDSNRTIAELAHSLVDADHPKR